MTPYYEDAWVTLYHADCRDVLPTLAAGSVDLVLTDPPYGTTALAWDKPVNWTWFWGEAYRLCLPAALQVLFSAQPFTTDLIVSNRANYRYELIWPKPMPTRFLDANRRPLASHENIQVFAAQFGNSTYNPQKIPGDMFNVRRNPLEQPGHYNKVSRTSSSSDTRYPTSVLKPYSKGKQQNSQHPTQKPLELLSWLIVTYSNPGDLIVDPYGGRGTTAWAAKKLGRRCVIAEAEERYCEIAARGLSQEVMNLAEVAA